MNATVKAICHWAEHPNTIRYVENNVILPLGATGMAALAVNDVWKAPSEERKKVLMRDALVLGYTAVGTLIAARGLSGIGLGKLLKKTGINTSTKIGSFLQDGLMKYPRAEGQHWLHEFVDHAKKNLKVLNYPKSVIRELKKLTAEDITPKDVNAIYKKLFSTVKKEHWGQVFPQKPSEGFMQEFEKALGFFLVGGISVLSGLAGGLVANKVNGVKDPDASINMIKEGIFQFVANIALCAVGASLALGVVNGEWGPNQPWNKTLRSAGAKFSKMVNKSKLARTGIIGAGLSIGILGGGRIANWLGCNYINPFCDKLQGKAPAIVPQGQPKKLEKRSIEFADGILHLDDVPTAMALAGVEIVTPFIPLFFAFSGYRTGIGYRNDGTCKLMGKTANNVPAIQPQVPQKPAQAFGQAKQALPFGAYYQGQGMKQQFNGYAQQPSFAAAGFWGPTAVNQAFAKRPTANQAY